MPPSSINISPSPRILRVLGDIEFQPWQCLAELVDNAFDDFLDLQRSGEHWPDGFRVGISLPGAGTPTTESEIVVTDSGRGMDLQTLNNAVRAGWSSNDRFSKLGLFGMGFNIATARLGRLTRVLTTRSGDLEWVGVEIDLDGIGDDFDVPVIRRPKSSVADHGTIVEVARLDPTRAGWLGRNAAKLRRTLGDVYGYLLDQHPFSLFVDGVKVRPRRPCVWGVDRSVTYGRGSTAEQIPAVIDIDETLPDAAACNNCGNWEAPDRVTCSECGGSRLEIRTRRIHGWLGIQRYLHKTEFGVDFLRNGRKILRYDKRLFEWLDPNDPLATPELEYPVELGQGGRIVGVIHLDHVPVNYQKNAFEWGDRNWIAAVRLLRGEGPLLPRRAKKLGYPPNDSPLARLHRGYRRNDPGYRSLVPGNGTGPIHASTLEWRDKFHKGDLDFQTDERWWEAIVYHEAKLAGEGGGGDAGTGDILDELGLGPTNTDEGSTPAAPALPPKQPNETEKERLARYRRDAIRVPELSREYGLTEFGRNIEVEVYQVTAPMVESSDGFHTPVLLARGKGRRYEAFVDLKHPVFRDFGDDPADYLAIEVVNHLRTRADHAMPLAQGVALLKDRLFFDRKIDQASLAGQARELLLGIRDRMGVLVSSNPDRAWQFLTPDERTATETNLVVEGSDLSLSEAESSGRFVAFTPLIFTARLVEEWPEAFMDGRLFRGPYESVKTPSARRVSVGRVVSYLYDAALVAEAKVTSPDHLSRCRISIRLLRDELVPEESGS